MTAADFMMQLEACLQPLAAGERENAMEYYREYFEEAGEDADAAAESLGSPQSVAQRIIAEAGVGNCYIPPQYSVPPRGAQHSGTDAGRIVTTVVVLLVTMPIWITVISLWVALIATLAIMLLSFVFAAAAGPIQGIIEIVEGLLGRGLWDIGAGLVCLGLALLLWQPMWRLAVSSTKGLWNLSKKCVFALLGKE